MYIPLLQKELDTFKNTVWYNHRGQKQRNKQLPDGILEHIYGFPEHYGGTKCGTHVSEVDLQEVAEVSRIREDNSDYLEPQFRAECHRVFPQVNEVLPSEALLAFRFLTENMNTTMIADHE